MAIEQLEYKLPAGFDRDKHVPALLRKAAHDHGGDWELAFIDPEHDTATLTRQRPLMEVMQGASDPDVLDVNFPKNVRISDGDRWAATFEARHPGYFLTRFEPHKGEGKLTRLPEDLHRVWWALAQAMSVKPWDLQVRPGVAGGYTIQLPRAYVPSKHDEKLAEVATVVAGEPGWYVTTDPKALTAQILPGTLPTFPATIAHPMAPVPAFVQSNPHTWARIPLGVQLAEPGQDLGRELATDFDANPMMQISGIAGSGKGVLITDLAAGALVREWDIAIVDAVKGGVDYVDLQPYVRDGGWAEDLREAVCVLQMTYDEGVRRKHLIKEHRVQKYAQLPAELGLRPSMVIVDEATSLLLPEPAIKGVPKDSEIALRIGERNLLKATALDLMGRIARELRFTAIALVMASQVASSTVGIPTELRANLPAKILLGAKPTENNRRLALASPDAVPTVPAHIPASDDGAARGCGVFEFEGFPPGVFKSYFSPPAQLGAWLESRGVARTCAPHPTAAQIARYTPTLDMDDDRPASRLDGGGFGERDGRDAPQARLRGAAAAAHQLKAEATT